MPQAPPTAAVARYLDLAVSLGMLTRARADDLVGNVERAVAGSVGDAGHGGAGHGGDAMAALRLAWVAQGAIMADDDLRLQAILSDATDSRTLLDWSTETGARTDTSAPRVAGDAIKPSGAVTQAGLPEGGAPDNDPTVDAAIERLAHPSQPNGDASRVEEASRLETMTFHERPTRVRLGALPQRPSGPFPDMPLGKFTPVRRLGEGGMGEVTLHGDHELGRDVAIKTLWPETAVEDRASIRFLEEAQITGQLEHPNIIPVYELGRDEKERPFLVMKCVRGRTLARVIEDVRTSPVGDDLMPLAGNRPAPPAMAAPQPTAEIARSLLEPTATELRERDESAANEPTPAALAPEGALAPNEALARLIEAYLKICDAVAYAHSRRVVHRDLKPENIMIGRFGEVLVMDWGLAKILPDIATPAAVADDARVPTAVRYVHGRSHKTMDGAVAGTPMYMSPEQAEGKTDAIDGRTDIYALGCVLYEILSLSAPFEASNTYELLGKVIQARIEPPRTRSRAPWSIPPELQAIALKAMARSPLLRYQSVGELKADVQAFQNNQPVSAHRDSMLQGVTKWARRRPAIALASATGAIAALLLGLIATALVNTNNEARREADRQEQIALAREGKIDELYEKLGVDLKRDFLVKATDFEAKLTAAQQANVPENDFVNNLTPDAIAGYLHAFNRLLEEAREHPDRIALEAWHYFYRGLLRDFAFGDQAGAMADYSSALEIDPDYPPALANRGNIRADRGDLAGAIEDFTRALQAAPDTALLYLNRAIAYLQRKEYDKAIADAQRGLQIMPNSGQLHGVAGEALCLAGRAEEAMAALNRSIELGMRTAITYYNRGVLRGQAGDTRGAIDDLTTAISLDDGAIDAYLNRGAFLDDIGEHARAIDDLTRVLLSRPNDEFARYNRASAYLALGRHDAALADLDRLITLAPLHVFALTDRGVLRAQRGDGDGAIADLEAALAIDETNVIANLNLGMLRIVQTRFRNAVVLLTRAIEGSPKDATAYYNRGLAYDALEEYDAAFADFTTAIEYDPTNGDAFNNRGTIHMLYDEPALALADFSAAVEVDGTSSEFLVNRAIAHLALQDAPAAIGDFERAIQLAPDDALLWYYSGKTRRESGDFAGAAADLEAALARNPAHWSSWVQLALARVQLGDKPRARQAFDAALACCPEDRREGLQDLRDRYTGD